MSKNSIQKGYDPSKVGVTTNNIFGLPYTSDQSALVFIPVPWDVTTSSFDGTSKGPENILKASYQIDLFAPAAPDAWQQGMAMEEIDAELIARNNNLRREAEAYIEFLEAGGDPKTDSNMMLKLKHINKVCESIAREIKEKSLSYLNRKQIPFLVGGDHSISSGQIEALAEKKDFGILQIDAHADLRNNYMGFTRSHASVMHRALHTQGVHKIVQVGIREICPEEQMVIDQNPEKIKTFFDHKLQHDIFNGKKWDDICNQIVAELPDKVYLTFDVDGLEPACCPGTGTPVPGGLSFNQAVYLIEKVIQSNKQIIGADLVETGPTNIDGIVSSRLLFHLASMILKSNKNR